CHAVWFYVTKTLIPLHIMAYYPMPEQVRWQDLPFALGLAGTVGVSVSLLIWGRRRPGLIAAWFSYLVILAPNSGLVPIGSQIAADRYSYMAMMSPVVLLAAGLVRVFQAVPRSRFAGAALAAGGAAMLAGLIVLTRGQCRTWLSSERLWA